MSDLYFAPPISPWAKKRSPISNAFSALQFSIFLRPAEPVRGGLAEVCAAFVIYALVYLAIEMQAAHGYFGWYFTLSPAGVIYFFGDVLAQAFVLAALLVLLRRRQQIGVFFVVAYMAFACANLLVFAAFKTVEFWLGYEILGLWGGLILWLGLSNLVLFAALSGLAAATGARFKGALIGGLVSCILTGFGYVSYNLDEGLKIFVPNYTYSEEEAQAPQWDYPDPEEIYPMQPELLTGQAQELAAQVPGQVDLYSLVGAGHPMQQVFQREVSALSTLLEQRFDGANRVLRLGASMQDPSAWPLLNRTNLASALQILAQKMDPREDVLLLYLTSHGSRKSISTQFPGLSYSNLSAAELAKALEASGIQNAVVVISACYSGSFVEDLAGPGRLVLTASAADRNSFGCSDENEFTNWGRAFVADGLSQTHDFAEAAVLARELVASQEAEAGLKPSLPQISVGEGIEQVLQDLTRGLSPGREAEGQALLTIAQ